MAATWHHLDPNRRKFAQFSRKKEKQVAITRKTHEKTVRETNRATPKKKNKTKKPNNKNKTTTGRARSCRKRIEGCPPIDDRFSMSSYGEIKPTFFVFFPSFWPKFKTKNQKNKTKTHRNGAPKTVPLISWFVLFDFFVWAIGEKKMAFFFLFLLKFSKKKNLDPKTGAVLRTIPSR